MYQLLAGILLLVVVSIIHRKIWSFTLTDSEAITGIIFEVISGIGALVILIDFFTKVKIF